MAASVFSFTQAKLPFMAIRRLLFPEATVSQTGSYCFTAGLWCRAQTLSPTPTLPSPPSLSQPPTHASLLCWFSELLFLSENLYEATERNETREREREGESGTQRDRAERERKTVIPLKLWSMLPACVCSARCQQRRALLICSHISIKKVGFQAQIFLCTCTNYQVVTK